MTRRSHAPAIAGAVVLLFLLSLGTRGGPIGPTSTVSSALTVGGHGSLGGGIGTFAQERPLSGPVNTVVATIHVPGGPTSLGATFDPSNGYVYFGSKGTNLTAIDGATNKISLQLHLGRYASPATPNYVGGSVNDLYVPVISTDPPPDNVTVVSGASDTIVKYLSTGGTSYPTTGVYDPSNGYLYVPAMGATLTSHVTVIDTATNSVVTTIPVGGFPSTPAFDAADGDIYVPNTYSSNNLSIIDSTTDKVVASLPIEFPASGTIAQEDHLTESPVYDPVTQSIFQPNTGNATLSEIQGTGFVRNITVGAGPRPPRSTR